MDDNTNVNTAILERLERIVESLQDNSTKMGQLLAVHDEKLQKQDRIDAVLFEKIESLHKDLERTTTEIKKGCELSEFIKVGHYLLRRVTMVSYTSSIPRALVSIRREPELSLSGATCLCLSWRSLEAISSDSPSLFLRFSRTEESA